MRDCRALYTGAVHAPYPLMCLAFGCAYACGAGYGLGGLCVALCAVARDGC